MYIQGNQYPSDFEAKKQMIEIGKAAGDKDWCIPGDGSISTRVGPNAVWITMQGADLQNLTQDSFLRIDLSGRQMISNRQKQLPYDAAVHLAVYSKNESLRSILHTYPPLLVVMALKGCSIEGASFTPALKAMGPIPLVQAESLEELEQQAVQAAGSVSGMLVSGDGCITWADTPKKAYQMTQAANYYEQVRKAGGCCESGKCDTCAFRGAGVAPAYCNRSAGRQQGANPAIPAGTPYGGAGQDGVTPLIRPGDANAFQLPDGSKPAPAAPQPAPAANVQHSYTDTAKTGQYRAHPVTTSAPSNATFMKTTYTPLSAQGAGSVRPVTVGTVPQNYSVRPQVQAQTESPKAPLRPSQRFGPESSSVIGSTGRFYGYSYGSKKETQQTPVIPKQSAAPAPVPAAGNSSSVVFTTQAAKAAQPLHGTEGASAQCPANVAANDPQIPYKRDDGPVKNAPKNEVMAEVVRRAINSMK